MININLIETLEYIYNSLITNARNKFEKLKSTEDNIY